MKFKILYQAKSNKNFFEHAESVYLKRIKRYIKLELLPLKPLKLSNALDVQQIREKEESYYKQFIPDQAFTILLDEKGKSLNSKQFAKQLESLMSTVQGDKYFIIGGAYGFSESFKAQANLLISLSNLTFAHHLARIVLLEQIYRGFSIINGEPYHNS